MIPVEFTLEPSTDFKQWLEYVRYMPWIDYLLTHAYNIDMNSVPDERRYMLIVTYKFHLEAKHETFYRLKYNSH